MNTVLEGLLGGAGGYKMGITFMPEKVVEEVEKKAEDEIVRTKEVAKRDMEKASVAMPLLLVTGVVSV